MAELLDLEGSGEKAVLFALARGRDAAIPYKTQLARVPIIDTVPTGPTRAAAGSHGVAERSTPAPETLAPEEVCRFWRADELDGLELLHATFVRHSFAPHTHDGYAVGVIERGVEHFRCGGRSHDAPAGSVVMVNPGAVHTGHSLLPIAVALVGRACLQREASAEPRPRAASPR